MSYLKYPYNEPHLRSQFISFDKGRTIQIDNLLSFMHHLLFPTLAEILRIRIYVFYKCCFFKFHFKLKGADSVLSVWILHIKCTYYLLDIKQVSWDITPLSVTALGSDGHITKYFLPANYIACFGLCWLLRMYYIVQAMQHFVAFVYMQVNLCI